MGKYGEDVIIPKGRIIYTENKIYNPQDFNIFYIYDGEISYIKKTRENKYLQFKLKNGDFACPDLVYTSVVNASIICSKETKAEVLTKEVFENNVSIDIEFAVKVITSLSRQLRTLDYEISVLLTKESSSGKDNLFNEGERLFQKGEYIGSQLYLNRFLVEYPNSPKVKKTLNYLQQIEQELNKLSEEKNFDITDQKELDQDFNIQKGLYELAFKGKDDISEELYKKFGRKYEQGEIIFKEGDVGKELFLILNGSVQVSKLIGDQERVLSVLKSGDIFGEMAIFEDKPRSATIKSLESTTLLGLTKDNFKMIFQLHPKWSLQMIQDFAIRIAYSYKSISEKEEKLS